MFFYFIIMLFLFRLAIYNAYDKWKAKARGLCGKGQLGHGTSQELFLSFILPRNANKQISLQ